jgi:membrane protease YdiL (CAAX protease family)
VLDVLLDRFAGDAFAHVGSPLAWFLLHLAPVLVVLAWPVLGAGLIERSRVGYGLTKGRGVLREAALGVLALPVVTAVTLATDLLVNPGPIRPHPIDELLLHPSLTVRTYFIADVLIGATFVEEIVFRGALYRFLRDGTAGLPRALGIASSALVSASLFAVCHPQGWWSMPALVAFGVVAALLREWRGSLVAPMALHGATWVWFLFTMFLPAWS